VVDSSSDRHKMDLVCPFDSDHPEFTRGFELGVLWERLKKPGPFEATLHATNAEMVMRVAEAAGRSFSGEDIGDDWVSVRFA
jgi:hypothetical protein